MNSEFEHCEVIVSETITVEMYDMILHKGDLLIVHSNPDYFWPDPETRVPKCFTIEYLEEKLHEFAHSIRTANSDSSEFWGALSEILTKKGEDLETVELELEDLDEMYKNSVIELWKYSCLNIQAHVFADKWNKSYPVIYRRHPFHNKFMPLQQPYSQILLDKVSDDIGTVLAALPEVGNELYMYKR